MQTMANGQSAGKQVVFKELPLDLNGYESKYKITNDGRVYSEYLGDFIKPFYSKGGYVRVKLNYGDRSKKVMMHRLVALAFIPNPENKPQVDHINRNRADNRVENLQWVTAKENSQLAVERGSKDSMKYIFINKKTIASIMSCTPTNLTINTVYKQALVHKADHPEKVDREQRY